MTDYWLPTWWDWIEDWSRCRACLEYNHAPCTSCEIPPGMLGLVCLVGGGTATVAGNLRGNVTIATGAQAQAASRMGRGEAAHPNPQAQINAIVRKQGNLIRNQLQNRERNQR